MFFLFLLVGDELGLIIGDTVDACVEVRPRECPVGLEGGYGRAELQRIVVRVAVPEAPLRGVEEALPVEEDVGAAGRRLHPRHAVAPPSGQARGKK